MIEINCSTKDEADQVIGAFDMLLSSVPDEVNPVPYNEISVNINGDPYEEWKTFVDVLNLIESLQ